MRRRHSIARVSSAVAALAASGALIGASPHIALLLAPALLLFLILALGMFPGEEVLARARRRRFRTPRARAVRSVAAPVLPDVARPAGVALAFALAMRPPPRAATGTH